MLSAMTLATMSAQAQSFHYPKAPQSDAKDRYFDVEIADPFRPLEDDNSAETQQWVAAENKLTRSYLDKLPQRERLMKRMKTLVNYEKIGTPFHVHGTWYVYKTMVCKTKLCVIRRSIWVENLLNCAPQTS